MIKIDKDVPMPTKERGNYKYPFRSMNVGDSFVVPASKSLTVRNSIWVWAGRNKELGYKFCTRIIGDEMRVWRVK